MLRALSMLSLLLLITSGAVHGRSRHRIQSAKRTPQGMEARLAISHSGQPLSVSFYLHAQPPFHSVADVRGGGFLGSFAIRGNQTLNLALPIVAFKKCGVPIQTGNSFCISSLWQLPSGEHLWGTHAGGHGQGEGATFIITD